jgi:hypothetical protein
VGFDQAICHVQLYKKGKFSITKGKAMAMEKKLAPRHAMW